MMPLGRVAPASCARDRRNRASTSAASPARPRRRRRARRPTACASLRSPAHFRATAGNRRRPDAGSQAPCRPRGNGRPSGRRIHMPSRKVIDGGRPAGELADHLAVAPVHRQRTGDALLRQMLHQAEEERQVGAVDALLVERQDVGAARRVQQEIGVLRALGDALVGQAARRAHIPAGTRRARPR